MAKKGNFVMENNTVLIVDDDVALLKMAEEILTGYYAVSLAKSGEQALKLLQTGFIPDVILLDIDMPHLNGYETIEKLHKIETVQDIPVIFLTGLTEAEAELKGLRAGAVDYITKPFVKEILLARLKVHLKAGKQQIKLKTLQKNMKLTDIDEEKFAQLTKALSDTERKIARLIALRYTNEEIGIELHYSYLYVKKVTGSIFEKMGISKRNELRKIFM